MKIRKGEFSITVVEGLMGKLEKKKKKKKRIKVLKVHFCFTNKFTLLTVEC